MQLSLSVQLTTHLIPNPSVVYFPILGEKLPISALPDGDYPDRVSRHQDSPLTAPATSPVALKDTTCLLCKRTVVERLGLDRREEYDRTVNAFRGATADGAIPKVFSKSAGST